MSIFTKYVVQEAQFLIFCEGVVAADLIIVISKVLPTLVEFTRELGIGVLEAHSNIVCFFLLVVTITTIGDCV